MPMTCPELLMSRLKVMPMLDAPRFLTEYRSGVESNGPCPKVRVADRKSAITRVMGAFMYLPPLSLLAATVSLKARRQPVQASTRAWLLPPDPIRRRARRGSDRSFAGQCRTPDDLLLPALPCAPGGPWGADRGGSTLSVQAAAAWRGACSRRKPCVGRVPAGWPNRHRPAPPSGQTDPRSDRWAQAPYPSRGARRDRRAAKPGAECARQRCHHGWTCYVYVRSEPL